MILTKFFVKAKVAFKFYILLFFCFIFIACSKEEKVAPALALESAKPSGEVLMQTFYWNVTPIGSWWDTLNTKLDSWNAAGITTLWLPVISKGHNGKNSMGYDPYDYFDFGQYNQHGTVETRFGSYAELKSLLANAKAKDFKLIADIVLNHNSGGESEFSPYSGKTYWTKFNPRSGKFNRNYEDFHPSGADAKDEDVFGGFPDLCHHAPNVKSWLFQRPDGVAKFYRDSLGFDGWRFDFVKGFNPSVVKEWNEAVGGIAIGEYWDENVLLINNWTKAANSAAFDFPLMYAMNAAFDGQNLTALRGKGLSSMNPTKAYTFVANHDVDEISAANKLMAYAFILTAEGTPCIFYSDYEALLDKEKLNNLIWINKNLAAGSTTTQFFSQTEYIFRRNGTPGLVAYFNIRDTESQRKVTTNWANAVLKDYTGQHADVVTDAQGYATIHCKGKAFAVYAPVL